MRGGPDPLQFSGRTSGSDEHTLSGRVQLGAVLGRLTILPVKIGGAEVSTTSCWRGMLWSRGEFSQWVDYLGIDEGRIWAKCLAKSRN